MQLQSRDELLNSPNVAWKGLVLQMFQSRHCILYYIHEVKRADHILGHAAQSHGTQTPHILNGCLSQCTRSGKLRAIAPKLPSGVVCSRGTVTCRMTIPYGCHPTDACGLFLEYPRSLLLREESDWVAAVGWSLNVCDMTLRG